MVELLTLWEKSLCTRGKEKQIHFRNTPMAGGAAWGHLCVPSGLPAERILPCFPYLISLYSSFVLVLPRGSPGDFDVWGRNASGQNSGWGSRWLWAVKNRSETFQFYVQLVPNIRGFIFLIAQGRKQTNVHISNRWPVRLCSLRNNKMSLLNSTQDTMYCN